ncbi:hypothetical protein EJ06DRAFT_388751 [Trichodelitschia bisporula]|uniref:tRNA (guanine-N(7)-)-methyltransferase n=1 Tax=Trichodelitschia bisporula TaxID=703511 RepID=A0A6G1HZB7_9PEZI|nr:hypothetical protein EJ06DRAFT_388751 [Trichodelitschia bisporula]
MPPPPAKRQKRDAYKAALNEKHPEEAAATLPKKRFYRQRAHANPFSDHALSYPRTPDSMDWSSHYPDFVDQSKRIEVADIGCGFGGLLFALSPRLPDALMLGMELRVSVAEFVQEKIKAMRVQNAESGLYRNISCCRANSMKFLPNFFHRAQLTKIFLCFPDPHFKARKHKARIVSATLTAEYAFVLRPGGIVYTITDVEDLHLWMKEHFEACPLFLTLTSEELASDECVEIMKTGTEEGKKVERNGGTKYVACFRRLEDPPWPV